VKWIRRLIIDLRSIGAIRQLLVGKDKGKAFDRLCELEKEAGKERGNSG